MKIYKNGGGNTKGERDKEKKKALYIFLFFSFLLRFSFLELK